MKIAQAVAFADKHHQSVLATRRASGGVQMSPVNSGVLDDLVVISTRAMNAKVANIQRDPAVSLLILPDGFYGDWVQIDGTAEIVDQPAALPLLDEVYRTIAGEHPDWDDYRAAMVRDRRVVVRIRPERASGQVG